MSQFFSSGGQSTGASASVLPMNIQDWFPLGWTDWISLQYKGFSRVFSNTTVQKHQTRVISITYYYKKLLKNIHHKVEMKKKHIHWKDWCWSWNSNTLATWCKELTHWIRSWCWERLKAGGEGDDRRWDGWMASLTQWTWVWVSSRSWWWTGKPGMLQSLGSQRVRHDWATELRL